MKRREFITLVGGVAAAWPVLARAQQPAIPVLGFVSIRSSRDSAYLLAAFRKGLDELGYVEGRNVTIEYRWADGQYDRLPSLATDLANRQVAIIVAASTVAAQAAKAATTTIPVVFTAVNDPVGIGLVASVNRPGGNITGISLLNYSLWAKRLEFLSQLAPRAAAIAILVNPNNPNSIQSTKDVQAAARTLGKPVHVLNAKSESEIDAAFAALVELRVGALLVGNDAYFNSRRTQMITMAASHAIPVIYTERQFSAEGGLMSYGSSLANQYRQAATYVSHILNGARPADLPVLLPIKFELVINLKTAKAIGLAIPDRLLALADEVIE